MMALSQMDILRHPQVEKRAKALYHSAFPKEERLPWWLLKLNAHRQGIDLTAWMEGDTFCGFTASVTVDGLHFLLFFAVDTPRQGMGYGSAILSKLRETYRNVVLNVELLEESAPNYPQRLRRFAFYQKNGFFDTHYDVWEIGGRFRVLSTQPQLDVVGYKKLFRRLSLGFWNVKVLQA